MRVVHLGFWITGATKMEVKVSERDLKVAYGSESIPLPSSQARYYKLQVLI